MQQHLMKNITSILAPIVAAGMLIAVAVTPASAEETATTPGGYTTSDNGDGTYTLPELNSDVPDISVTRVPKDDPNNKEGRDIYYMVSTTMELSPGAPIMKSYDLVNWKIVTYVYDRISMSDASSLRNGASSYGEGEWAPSIRYHDGKFYVLFNTNNLNGAYIYYTNNVENGPWTKVSLNRGFHDPSLFFDDGDNPWIISGANEYKLDKSDLKTVVETHENIISAEQFESTMGEVPNGFEGSQIFKIGKYFYNPTIYWGKDGRTVMLLRTTDLLDGSKYEAKKYLLGGFAQGSLVEIAKADGTTNWNGFFFRDTYPTGRMPALIPATWGTDAWPVFGNNNKVSAGDVYTKQIQLPKTLENLVRQESIVNSDDFDNDAKHQSYQDQDWWTLPTAPTIDESLINKELVTNGDFEAGTNGWDPQYGATLTASNVNPLDGKQSLNVTNRKWNGSGPGQSVDGKIQKSVTYKASATIHYDNEADGVDPSVVKSHKFNVALEYNGGINAVASGTVSRGQTATISGTFTVPSDADVTGAKLVVETQWNAPGTLMDYTIDNISLIGQPSSVEYPVESEYKPNGSNLDMTWEWAHNPDNRYWSLTNRPGWLRLTNGHLVQKDAQYMKGTKGDLTYFETARNMLSQRTFSGNMSVETKMDVSHMKDGDTAGVATYTRSFSYAAVRQNNGQQTLGVVSRVYDSGKKDADGNIIDDTIDRDKTEAFVDGTTVSLPAGTTNVWIKSDNVLNNSNGQLTVQYLYSLDGNTWKDLGGNQGPFGYDWSLSHFKGYRIGLFNYAKTDLGGYVDYDYYDLSNTLSSENKPVTTDNLDAAVKEAQSLKQSEYPADEWATLQTLVKKAQAVSKPSTQNEVDAPQRALSLQLAQLAVDRTPETVIPVTGITVNPAKSSVTVGDTVTLTATVAPANASNTAVTWTSSDSSIATVSAEGVVMALKAGTVTINATSADGTKVVGSAEIQVVAKDAGGNTGGNTGNTGDTGNTGGSDDTSGSSNNAGSANGGAATSTLSKTGAAIGIFAIVAGVLAAAGAGLVALRRRKV